MSTSSRFSAGLFSALPAVLFFFLSPAAAAPAKSEPAAPVAGEPITAADVRKLQDTIKGLHDRFEDQGKILYKNSDDLGRLANRVEDYLKPGTLDPVKTGLAAVVNKIANLQEAVGKQAEAQDKQTADTAGQMRELAAATARLQEQIAKSEEARDAGIVRLRQAIAATYSSAASTSAPADATAPLLPLLAAIAAATLILAGLILLHGRAQHRARQTGEVQLAAALDRLRDSLLAKIETRPAGSVAVPSGGDAGTGNGPDGLAEIRAKLQRVLDHLKTPVPSVQPDEHTTKNYTAPPADEQPTARLPGPNSPGIPSAACWPAAFMEPGTSLSAWRERIESHLASPEHPALPVLAAFLALRTLCTRRPVPSLDEVGTAVVTLSQTLYAYWESLPELSDDDQARASSDWIKAVKAMIATAAPKLEIREIIAGARFDSDSMQTVQEGSGNHLLVAAVHSWAILDRSGERVKVLQRARIATN